PTAREGWRKILGALETALVAHWHGLRQALRRALRPLSNQKVTAQCEDNTVRRRQRIFKRDQRVDLAHWIEVGHFPGSDEHHEHDVTQAPVCGLPVVLPDLDVPTGRTESIRVLAEVVAPVR